MQGLDVVKVIGDGAHFHHAVAVVGCEALDFCSSVFFFGVSLSSECGVSLVCAWGVHFWLGYFLCLVWFLMHPNEVRGYGGKEEGVLDGMKKGPRTCFETILGPALDLDLGSPVRDARGEQRLGEPVSRTRS